MVLAQGLEMIPVRGLLNRLGQGIGVIKIAVAHDLDQVHIDVVVIVQMRLYASLTMLLVFVEMEPETHRRAIHGQMIHTSQYTFTFIHGCSPNS